MASCIKTLQQCDVLMFIAMYILQQRKRFLVHDGKCLASMCGRDGIEHIDGQSDICFVRRA